MHVRALLECLHTSQGAFWRWMSRSFAGCCFATMTASTVSPGRGYLQGRMTVEGFAIRLRHAHASTGWKAVAGDTHLYEYSPASDIATTPVNRKLLRETQRNGTGLVAESREVTLWPAARHSMDQVQADSKIYNRCNLTTHKCTDAHWL